MYELLIVYESVNQQRKASALSPLVYPVETKALFRQIKLGSLDNSAFLVSLWLGSCESLTIRFPKGTPSSGSHDMSCIVFPHLLLCTHQSCCLGNNRQPFHPSMQTAIVTVSLSWNVEFSTLVFHFSYGINNALFWWFWILWYFWGFFQAPFPFESRCSLSVSRSPPYLERSYTGLTVSDLVKCDGRTLRP